MRKNVTLTWVVMLLFSLCVLSLSAQETNVSGTILADEDGSPLIGVTVTNTATSKRTSTNQAGYFSISATKGQKIVFTYVGYVSREVVVGDTKIISLRLVANDKSLDDVVVTAYGRQQAKRELAYQTPTIKGDDVAQTRRDNFLNGLAGRVPGLTVTSTSGLPGASAQIILRGGTSIGGNNQPLFVVDGVPQDNSTINQESLIAASNTNASQFANRNSDYTNRIADLNPADIESIVVLKGPEATALFGSDGTSGAIVITTKKATTGKARLNYDNSFRVDQVYRFPEIQDTYMRGTNGIYDPNAYTTYGFRMFGPKFTESKPKYDNLRAFFQNGFSQQHNLSVEAGTNDVSFRFSAGYLTQSGVVPNSKYERLTTRLSGSAKLGNKMVLTSSWLYSLSSNDKPQKGVGSYYPNLINWPLDDEARIYLNPDGTRRALRSDIISGGAVTYSSEVDNPFWDVNANYAKDRTDRLTGTVNLAYDPFKWWNITTILGLDHFITDGLFLTHPQSRWGFATRGFISTYQSNFRSVNGTVRTTFKKKIGDNITNNLTLGFYTEDNKRSITAQKGERFYEPNFVSINNTDPLSRDAKLTLEKTRKVRFFGNYTFGFKNLWFVSLSATREGSSTFNSVNRDQQPFFNYGSVSSSFVFSDLAPIKDNLPWLSYGKLRASYATSGKGPLVPYIVDFGFTSQITTGGGYAFGFFGNNYNLRPEIAKNFEIGAEMKFFKNRFGIDVAFFNNRMKDQIISNRLSYGTGFVLQYINGGELSAKGVELQLTGSPVKAKNFSWDVTLNFDRSKVIVEKMPADLPFYYDSDTWLFGNARAQVSPGVSLSNISGYTFRRNTAGQLLISPTTGLPLIDANFVPIGDRNPTFKIGLINNFTIHNNLSISFNLDIRKGGDIFNANEMMMYLQGTSLKTMNRETPRVLEGVLLDGLENTPTPTKNNISIIPALRNDYYNSAIAEADFIESVDWIRLRDITASYRIPATLLKRQKLFKQASVFVTGTDLFLITNYSGVDPNVNGLNSSTARGFGGAGIDFGAIPTPRGINIGIKAQF